LLHFHGILFIIIIIIIIIIVVFGIGRFDWYW